MEFATVVGGALLSASFEKLLNMLASPELRQFISKKEVQSQLHQWESMLPKIHAVLEDAQDKQSTSRLVQIWLSELRDLVYDVEDVLDEFATEALRLKLKDKHQTITSSSKVKTFLPFRVFSGSGSTNFSPRMGSKLKEITCRMETICTQKTNLDLGDKVVVGRGGRSEITTTRIPTTSLPDSYFFGRDKDKQTILDSLLAEGASVVDVVSVIPILGMGGLGKTTLAQELYNDDKVKLRFDLRAWACVSDTFDILSITRTILQSVGGGGGDGMNLDQLQINLEKTLSEKKFLIVLDDVWNEKYEDWTILCKPFRRGARGSKIIVTTRNQQVAELTGTTRAYRLGELSYEDCFCLFAQHALGATNFDGHQDLKDVGQKIVERCKGLPLAAKTLGGLLRTKLQHHEWVEILESQIWHLPEDKSDILPALRLSYHHLPSHLKQCFAYCAVFPSDYEFNVDELVLLWMAEGFLSHPNRKKHLEVVGIQYFHELLARSFFQPSNKDCARFVMHDLIHDLAKAIMGELCFHLDKSVERHEQLPTLKTRHASFILRTREVSRRFEVFDEGKSLRTLFALPAQSLYDSYHISVDVLDKLISKLINLRALSLNDYQIREVPGSVKGLKHLRYLNLSKTRIKLLPDFVCSLLNLQTLLLRNCSYLEKLPSSIGNLPHLCHLDIRGTYGLKEMPVGIGNLTELRYLGKFIVGVGRDGGLNIRELRNLSQLKGELSLEGLQNVEKLQDARDADLKCKQDLQGLAMKWNNNDNNNNLDDLLSRGGIALKVLESLQPHVNLERLEIESYYGLEFPTWVGNPFLMSNMTKIELCNCWRSMSLPCLGRLPVLKHLIIKGMKAIKTLGFEFFGSDNGGFESLETLKLENMQGLEKWCLSGRKFPSLLELEMLKCPVLVGECSVRLPSLCKLVLRKCDESVLRCMTDMCSLRALHVWKISGLSCLHDTVGQWLAGLEDLKIYECENLSSLWQSEPQIEDNMTCLKSLKVRDCPNLVSFLTATTIKNMTSLESMIVKRCPRIHSPQIEHQEGSNDEVKSTWKLRTIKLCNCGDQFVECVVNGVVLGGDQCVLVDCLRIRSCDSLKHLAIRSKRGGNKVKSLIIEWCKNLVTLSNSFENSSSIVEIDQLRVYDCPSLMTEGTKLLVAVKKLDLWTPESVAEESITMVEEISIRESVNLKSLPEKLHQLTSLTSLDFFMCDGLESFPERGLPIPNLRTLRINRCKNLKGLPNNMESLTSLESLAVINCSCLEFFPEVGLPPNLIELVVVGCSSVKQQMLESGLSRLTSLRRFVIEGDTSAKDMLVPTTLEDLSISDMTELECISCSSKCCHVQEDLSSLTSLYISGCPKLGSLSKEVLPPILEVLHIKNCPILRNKCSVGKGKYWPVISLIPNVKVE